MQFWYKCFLHKTDAVLTLTYFDLYFFAVLLAINIPLKKAIASFFIIYRLFAAHYY